MKTKASAHWKGQREMPGSPDLPSGPGDSGGILDLELRDLGEELFDGDLHFHPSQSSNRRSGECPRRTPRDDFAGRSMSTTSGFSNISGSRLAPGKFMRILSPSLHWAALEINVFADDSGHGHRRVRPQQLLNRVGDQGRIAQPIGRGLRDGTPDAKALTRWNSKWCRCPLPRGDCRCR